MSTSFEKKNWITWNVICLLWIYQERKTGCPADFISTLIVWSNLRWWNGKSCCKVPVPTRTRNWSDIEHSTWNDDLLGIMTCCWLCMYATYKHIKSMVWRIPRWEVSGEESCLDGKRVTSWAFPPLRQSWELWGSVETCSQSSTFAVSVKWKLHPV